MLSVGNSSQNSSAKVAGVCLLIVLFAFGLFFNPAPSSVGMSRFPIQYKAREAIPMVLPATHERVARMLPSLVPPAQGVGYGGGTSSRELLTLEDDFDDNSPMDTTSTTSSLPLPETVKPEPIEYQSLPLVVKRAGTYEVSYTPNPNKYLPSSSPKGHSHTHTHRSGADEKDWMANSTSYMLYLDPRPDSSSTMGDGDDIQLHNKGNMEENSHTTTHTFVKYSEGGLPPMIISLILPSDLTNGTNPLLPPKDVNPEDSIIELTCKVLDVSLTTRIDRSRHTTQDN